MQILYAYKIWYRRQHVMTEKGTKELYLQLSRHNAVTAGAVCVADIAGIYGVNAMECDVPSDLSRLFFTPSCIFKVSLLSWLASK